MKHYFCTKKVIAKELLAENLAYLDIIQQRPDTGSKKYMWPRPVWNTSNNFFLYSTFLKHTVVKFLTVIEATH